MRRVLAHVIALVPLTLAALTIGAGTPTVEYRDDRLTVHMSRVAVNDGVQAIERATGADVRGQIPREGELSVDLESVPLREGLARIFGDDNFAIIYRGDGRLVAVEVLGGPLPALARRTASPNQDATADASPTPEGILLEAGATLQAFLERNPIVEVDDEVALGRRNATFRELLETAATADSRRVRVRALRRSVRAIRADPEAWHALETVVATASLDRMRDFMRHLLGPHAEELTRELAVHGDPALRTQAKAVLQELVAQARRSLN